MNAPPVAVQVVWLLRRRRQTVATAESITGGLIGKLITDVPGASEVYRGGVISYATELKHTLLHVSRATLDRVGPVAAETAQEMAAGAAASCAADYGLAVTGVAGPDPQGGHRVGQVFIAVAGPGGLGRVRELELGGDRAQIRSATALEALRLLADLLDAGQADGPAS